MSTSTRGHPESGVIEDEALRSREGFDSARQASEATKALFPDMHLVMLHGRYSGVIVAIRRPGQAAWASVAERLVPG